MTPPRTIVPPPSDSEVLQAGLPYLRSIVALLVYLRTPNKPDSLSEAYGIADVFLGRLLADVEAAAKKPR